jgi:valyl-tRNA synthetase
MSNGGSYDPARIEPDIYRFWESGHYFDADVNPQRRPYVIDLPLPNVTGALHLGHALNNTLQDILIRHARMQGFEALWMPGTDHAGIATQAVVERKLKEEQNLTRHELGREGLVKKIWEWKEEYGGRILSQLRKIGCSCDWRRTRFTLDEVCAKAVYEAFFQWFKAGLIYRGLRLVNWDAYLQTAVADDEIIHETVQGHLWHIRYPLQASDEATKRRSDERLERPPSQGGPQGGKDATSLPDATLPRPLPERGGSQDYLVVATTRPETMLGDTAVAVHPDDERYQHLIGKHCLLPLMNRPIPIIADGILVKREFGTGCVKVTPGHDPNDYAFAQRHPEAGLINVLTPDGRINQNGGVYAGLDRYEARKRVVADLEKLGLLEKIEPYETEIGHSDRSKTPIEPLLSEQWFVKMADLAEAAMEAVRDDRMMFYPARYARTFLDWLGEKRDWCISRQLWWGHRIPVWTRRMSVAELRAFLDCPAGRSLAAAGADSSRCCVRVVLDDGSSFIFGDEASHARLRALDAAQPLTWYVCVRHPQARWPADPATIGERLSADGFEQDPDVLDTWFSSGLWPMSTLGWPDDYGRQQGNKAARQQGNEATGQQGGGSANATLPRGLDASLPMADLDYFFPTSVLVTAREIITLWVARMAIFTLHFTGRVPFQHVHIHPNIQDGQGRRMSKSAGNGVDPLDISELYGTDALRFTMAQMDTETQDVRLPVKPTKMPDGRTANSSEKFELGRNFCNKLWQVATGFVLPNLSDEATERPAAAGKLRDEATESSAPVPAFPRFHVPTPLHAADLALEDRWILSRLAGCIADVDTRYAQYQLSDVAGRLYAFFWGDFCDWYVELVKSRIFSSSPPSQGGVGGGSAVAGAGGGGGGPGGRGRSPPCSPP